MTDVKTLTRSDTCPNCGGGFKDAPVPSEAQWAAAMNHEDPVFLPTAFDSASPDFRKEHGALARCTQCGYATRFPLER